MIRSYQMILSEFVFDPLHCFYTHERASWLKKIPDPAVLKGCHWGAFCNLTIIGCCTHFDAAASVYGCFPDEPGLAGYSWSSFFNLFGREHLAQTFYGSDVIPSIQPTVSKHWRTLKALTAMQWPGFILVSFTTGLDTRGHHFTCLFVLYSQVLYWQFVWVCGWETKRVLWVWLKLGLIMSNCHVFAE